MHRQRTVAADIEVARQAFLVDARNSRRVRRPGFSPSLACHVISHQVLATGNSSGFVQYSNGTIEQASLLNPTAAGEDARSEWEFLYFQYAVRWRA